MTKEGKKDSAVVLEFLMDKKIDAFYCSPYKRSMDSIADAAAFFGKEIITDERLREREKGPDGNNHGMFQKRWADHDYHEEGGESIAMVQNRNIEVLNKILSDNTDKDIVLGTHGTALSTILNFYDNSFGCEDFLRIIDWMHILSNWILKEISWLANRNIVMWRRNLRENSVGIRSNTFLSVERL